MVKYAICQKHWHSDEEPPWPPLNTSLLEHDGVTLLREITQRQALSSPDRLLANIIGALRLEAERAERYADHRFEANGPDDIVGHHFDGKVTGLRLAAEIVREEVEKNA